MTDVTIKGLTGPVEVTAGETTLAVSDYGNPAGVPVTDLKYGTVSTLVDTSAQSIVIDSHTPGIRVLARNDNNITIDLRGYESTDPVSIQYTRTIAGVPELVDTTLTVSKPFYKTPWPKADFYEMEHERSGGEFDDGDLLPLPSDKTRVVCIKDDGLTPADIEALEVGYSNVSEANVNGTWLRNNTAQGGTRYYGQGDDLALEFELGIQLGKRLRSDFKWHAPFVLFKRGSVFPAGMELASITVASGISADFGQSSLHPIYYGAYGTGARPVFQGKGIALQKSGNVVVSSMTLDRPSSIRSWSKDVIMDNMRYDQRNVLVGSGDANVASMDGGNTGTVHSSQMRRMVGIANHRDVAVDPDEWSPADRESFCHPGSSANTKYSLLYSFESGSSVNYRADQSTLAEKSAENQSHFIYESINCYGTVFSDMIALMPSGSWMQVRGTAQILNSLGSGGNTGYNVGIGAKDYDMVYHDEQEFLNNYSFVYNTWLSGAGFKGYWDGSPGILGGSAQVAAQDASFMHSGSMNSGEPTYYISSTDIGPGVDPTSNPISAGVWWPFQINQNPGNNPGNPGTVAQDSYIYSNWNRSAYPDHNVGDTSPEDRDAATLGAFTDDLLSTTGSDVLSLASWLNEESNTATPWRYGRIMADLYRELFGLLPSAPVPNSTVYFEPEADYFTPGSLGYIEADWSGKRLPGRAVGQSVNLQGHNIYWNQTPTYDLVDLTFGGADYLSVKGGALPITGTVNVDTAGNVIEVYRGARVILPALSGLAGVLTLDATNGHIRLSDTTSLVDIKCRYESDVFLWDGADATVPNGTTWTMYGYGHMGYDGNSVSSNVSVAGTLVFKPTIRIQLNNCIVNNITADEPGSSDPKITDLERPAVGAVITNGTYTGVVRDWYRTGTSTMVLIVDDLTGEFSETDTISADSREFGGFAIPAGYVGTIDSMEVEMGSIGDVYSGLNGFDSDYIVVAPDVNSTVDLTSSSTVLCDTFNLPSGTYDLITATSLTVSTTNLPDGVIHNVAENKLQLVV